MEGGPACLQVRGPVWTGGGSWDAGWCHLPGLELESRGHVRRSRLCLQPCPVRVLGMAASGSAFRLQHGGLRTVGISAAFQPECPSPGFETRVSMHTCFLLSLSP